MQCSGRGRACPARGPDREHPFSVHLRAAYMRPLHARCRGMGCCAESARSGQDRSLHGTRERRIVGRGLDPSAGFALPHTPTGGYGIRPYGAGVDAPHRPGKLLPVSVGAGHARPAARTASTRFPYTCGPHICGPYMRGAGEWAAARRVPGAVKTAPYMAPVNGES